MVQRIVDIKTDGLTVFEKETQRLILCLEYCCITIALANKSTNHWVAVEVLQCSEEDIENMDELMLVLQQHSLLLNYTELETKIFIRSAHAIVIPTKLQEDAKQLLQIQFGLQKLDIVIKEQVNSTMAVALKTKSGWLNPFSNLFSDATIHAFLTGLIKHTLEYSRTSALPVLQIVFSNGMVEIVLAKNNELHIAKCLRFSTVQDMNYELLNICKQLKVSPAEVVVIVQGLVNEGSPIHLSLLTYFAEVQFANTAIADWGFKNIPNHYFTSLIQASS